jgi:chromosome segregation ATPase
MASTEPPLAASMRAAAEEEAALAAEEAMLVQKAAALEKQVQRHRQQKAALAAAREQAAARQKSEDDMQQWQGELRTEVEGAVARLNEQRVVQLERCAEFEEKLVDNIETMQHTLHQVRRRAAALDTAFDSCVQRLSSAYVDAVALRRQQQAQEANQEAQQAQRAQQAAGA